MAFADPEASTGAMRFPPLGSGSPGRERRIERVHHFLEFVLDFLNHLARLQSILSPQPECFTLLPATPRDRVDHAEQPGYLGRDSRFPAPGCEIEEQGRNFAAIPLDTLEVF